MAAKYPAGSYFTQKSGPRTGQKFQVKTGKSGLAVRKYETGDTAVTTPGPKPQTQTKGARAGQAYTVKKGKSGKNVRVYKSGDTAAF